MAWKIGSYCNESAHLTPVEPKPIRKPQERLDGDLVALVGQHSTKEHFEKLNDLKDVFGYSLDQNRVLIRCSSNESKFDTYIAYPFTKGMTERETGRTLLILGSNAHHGEAMQNQFDQALWTPDPASPKKSYGDTIRWINIGDLRQGFIGLDYEPKAKQTDGVATSLKDIKFLSQTLISYGFDEDKRLFLLKPPYIIESESGKELRKRGIERLIDMVRKL